MPGDTIEQWEHTQAELEIRRWLSEIGLWAPGAERYGWQSPDEIAAPRLLAADEIDQVLHSEVVGRIGCHAHDKTYVVPIAYVYDGQYIYGHTGDGLKLRMLRENPDVCFEVDHIDGLTNWQSVIAWGRFEELHGAEADRAMRLLAERIRPFVGNSERPLADTERAAREEHPVVYRIGLRERTGRADKRS